MPSLERDEDMFLVDCEVLPLATSSPTASGDFTKDGKLSSYGSTDSGASRTSTLITTAIGPVGRVSPPTTNPPKDPEQSPLLAAVLPPPGGWGGVPPGLTSADILPLASDPFWCRLRAALFGLFWVVMVALLACVVVIVVNDPQPCTPPGPPATQEHTVNVSLPLSALHALQAVSVSRY